MKKELTKKEKRELLTRKKLIDAAKKLFREKGYKNTSVDEIADEALLSKGTFYQYFKSKENLFLATMSETESEVLNLIDEQVLGQSFNNPQVLFKELLNCLFGYFEQDYYFIHLTFFRESGFNKEIVTAMREIQIHLNQKLVAVFEKLGLKDEKKAHDLALSLIGAMYVHTSFWFFNYKEKKISLKDRVPVLMDQFYHYFQNQ